MVQKMDRDQALNFLIQQRLASDKIADKDGYRKLLAEAGKTVGYKPAFRCLVLGATPEDAIRWQ